MPVNHRSEHLGTNTCIPPVAVKLFNVPFKQGQKKRNPFTMREATFNSKHYFSVFLLLYGVRAYIQN